MIYLLTLTKEDSEKEMLSKAYKNIAAKISDDYWDMKFVRSIAEGREFLANEPLLDFLCVDVTLPGSVEFLSVIRKKYEKAGLLLMVDISIPPTAYLKPGIRPDAIIVKPLKEDNTDETLEEFFGTYFSEHNLKDDDVFMVETREGKTIIPFSKIFYFEAREKKVFLRTLHEEFGFYSTIEELAARLPDFFLRTHRSFIVNKGMVENYKNSMLNLRQGFSVPVSRSYKPMLMEGLRKNSKGE